MFAGPSSGYAAPLAQPEKSSHAARPWWAMPAFPYQLLSTDCPEQPKERTEAAVSLKAEWAHPTPVDREIRPVNSNFAGPILVGCMLLGTGLARGETLESISDVPAVGQPEPSIETASYTSASVVGDGWDDSFYHDAGPVITVYGFAQADYIQDFNRVAAGWEDTLRPSRIPTVDGLLGADGKAWILTLEERVVAAWVDMGELDVGRHSFGRE